MTDALKIVKGIQIEELALTGLHRRFNVTYRAQSGKVYEYDCASLFGEEMAALAEAVRSIQLMVASDRWATAERPRPPATPGSTPTQAD